MAIIEPGSARIFSPGLSTKLSTCMSAPEISYRPDAAVPGSTSEMPFASGGAITASSASTPVDASTPSGRRLSFGGGSSATFGLPPQQSIAPDRARPCLSAAVRGLADRPVRDAEVGRSRRQSAAEQLTKLLFRYPPARCVSICPIINSQLRSFLLSHFST